MKTTPSGLLSVAALALFAASVFSAPIPPAPSTMETGTHETVELKVLKVFSAQDGDAIFRAYLVEWNGQEVIVEDTLAKTHYRTDDTIRVLVMKQPYPKNQEAYGLLHFTIMPERPRRR